MAVGRVAGGLDGVDGVERVVLDYCLCCFIGCVILSLSLSLVLFLSLLIDVIINLLECVVLSLRSFAALLVSCELRVCLFVAYM